MYQVALAISTFLHGKQRFIWNFPYIQYIYFEETCLSVLKYLCLKITDICLLRFLIFFCINFVSSKRDISAANFVMHEMHCRRHIVLCEHCGEPVHRSEVGQHFSNLHAKIPCEKCQQMISKSDMAKHLVSFCVFGNVLSPYTA